MLRFLIIGAAFLASGPLAAILILSLGCTGSSPLLGVACGHNAIFTLIAVTAFTWLAAAVALSVFSARRTPQ